jgi:DNA helicase-2/ATP-dependent DNA helicase PcrA
MPVDFQRELNEEQHRAVCAGDGAALVLAAAGTGKTRTLVYRVARLIEGGVPPGRILLLTFTNRAAREMLERAAALTGRAVSELWGGTFHHLANRVLRRHAELAGYAPGYTILDREDARALVARCVKARAPEGHRFPRAEVLLALFSEAANTERRAAEMAPERFDRLDAAPADIAAILTDYEARKRAMNAMDFDDLLVLCRNLLRDHPEVLALYRERFLHVLVDEYQDTNALQAQIVDALAGEAGNLFVVGDDFQSIYSWRGADYRNILRFPERHAGASVYKLETNYRSVPEVLAVANACIAGNPEQFQKTLRATRTAGERPRVVRLRDGQHQAEFVVREVERLRGMGWALSDIAVLYRAHFHAMELQLALSEARIPYHVTSGVRFFEQAHVKDVLGLLRVLTTPSDRLAFERLIGLLTGAGPRSAERAWLALGGAFDAGDAAARKRVAQALRGAARAEWNSLCDGLARHAGAACRAPDAIEEFVDGFYGAYAEAAFENADRRLEDLRELAVFAGRYESAAAFLNEVALLTNLDAEADAGPGSEQGADALRLSTVHQAKGLEWRAVIVLWAVEGMFPSGRSVDESEGGEAEERRLFYVAVTRARDELCLCVPEVRRMRDGGLFFCQPSRYVAELDGEQVRSVRPARRR